VRSAVLEGPPPELWRDESEQGLLGGLAARVEFYTATLGYEEANVAVLVTRDSDVQPVREALAARHIDTTDIRRELFDFDATPSVRLSTVHAAKGLEFPVVMLYAPEVPVPAGFSEQLADVHRFNLLYVAVTRATDSLELFFPTVVNARAPYLLAEAVDRLRQDREPADTRR
jgi:superfamily I DNA/RNA helicase